MRYVAYQLYNGRVVSAAQYTQMWPGGKRPGPKQRQMLGIRPLTEREIFWGWDPTTGALVPLLTDPLIG